MKLLELSLEDILLDTLEYYSGHPERICETESKCAYNPATIGKENVTEGCAIGRLIDIELATTLDKENCPISGVLSLQETKAYSEPLYDKITENLSFFCRLQDLHDRNYITEVPLSYTAKSTLKELIDKNNFNPELFTKWLS